MMTQSELLELAKQGNPQAIAALMNLVLEPKGVTAKASLEAGNLQLLFASNQLLSQSAIVSFVRSGLANLGATAIQRVKIYAQQIGQEVPVWTDGFSLTDETVAPASSKTRNNAPAASVSPAAIDLQVLELQSEPALPAFFAASQPSASTHSNQPALKKIGKAHNGSRKKLPKQTGQPFSVKTLLYKIQSSNRYVLASAIALGAFVFGGVVALVTNSQAGGASQHAMNSSQLFQQDNNSSPDARQTGAKTYLAQMNKAQQTFYQTNHRFAATLEELERSAALISQSSDYTYKLVTRDQTQSVITAVPKDKGLKSYSGSIFLAQDPQVSGTAKGILCETNQPSNFPPVLSQANSELAQCPADSTQVPY